MSTTGFMVPGGTTELSVIPGDPIAQGQASIIFNDVFRRAQRDAVMVVLRVLAANLASTFAGLRRVEEASRS
jgi:hypothetical protein